MPEQSSQLCRHLAAVDMAQLLAIGLVRNANLNGLSPEAVETMKLSVAKLDVRRDYVKVRYHEAMRNCLFQWIDYAAHFKFLNDFQRQLDKHYGAREAREAIEAIEASEASEASEAALVDFALALQNDLNKHYANSGTHIEVIVTK